MYLKILFCTEVAGLLNPCLLSGVSENNNNNNPDMGLLFVIINEYWLNRAYHDKRV